MTTIVGNRGQLRTSTLSAHLVSHHLDFPEQSASDDHLKTSLLQVCWASEKRFESQRSAWLLIAMWNFHKQFGGHSCCHLLVPLFFVERSQSSSMTIIITLISTICCAILMLLQAPEWGNGINSTRFHHYISPTWFPGAFPSCSKKQNWSIPCFVSGFCSGPSKERCIDQKPDVASPLTYLSQDGHLFKQMCFYVFVLFGVWGGSSARWQDDGHEDLASICDRLDMGSRDLFGFHLWNMKHSVFVSRFAEAPIQRGLRKWAAWFSLGPFGVRGSADGKMLDMRT